MYRGALKTCSEGDSEPVLVFFSGSAREILAVIIQLVTEKLLRYA
jgi:hypothetical protein